MVGQHGGWLFYKGVELRETCLLNRGGGREMEGWATTLGGASSCGRRRAATDKQAVKNNKKKQPKKTPPQKTIQKITCTMAGATTCTYPDKSTCSAFFPSHQFSFGCLARNCPWKVCLHNKASTGLEFTDGGLGIGSRALTASCSASSVKAMALRITSGDNPEIKNLAARSPGPRSYDHITRV